MKTHFKYGNGPRAALKWLLAAFAFLLVVGAFARAQRVNTQYVTQFPGTTVAAKTIAAQAACNPAVPCVLIFDADLSVYPVGSLPGRGVNESWWDYYSHAGQTFYNGSAVGSGGGGGTPGGVSGNVQVNSSGTFAAINGTSFSNNASLASGSINSLAIAPVAATGAGSLVNALHAFAITTDDQVSSVGSGTDAGIYAVCNNHATGGAFGHELCMVSRAGSNTVGASSISLVSSYWGDYTQTGTDTVSQADVFANGGWNISAGTLQLAVGVNMGSAPAPSGTGAVTAWNGLLGQAPVAGVPGLTTAVTADFGNCNPNAGTGLYVNLVVCGAEADFAAPINIKTSPAAASAAPVTNAAPYAMTFSEQINADVSGGAGAINIDAFGLNGSGSISQVSGVNSLVEEENVATVTEADAFRAGYRVTSGGTVSKAVGLHVISPQGTSTVTNGYGVYVDNLNTAVVNTNPPVGFSTADGFEVRSKWRVDANGFIYLFEQAAPSTPPAGQLVLAANNSAQLTCTTPAGGNCLPGTGTTVTIGSGTTAALPTTSMAAGACSGISTSGLVGTNSTDTLTYAVDSQPTNMGLFTITPSNVSGTMSFLFCNPTAGALTLGGTAHILYRVVR